MKTDAHARAISERGHDATQRMPMTLLDEKFGRLNADDAPGQEVRQASRDVSCSSPDMRTAVDFSHGDVDAFLPTPGSTDAFFDGVCLGGTQAYTEYRGSARIRCEVASKLSRFTGARVSGVDDLIITSGSQGALFLTLASSVTAGDKVAVLRPDYFANRKIVEFLDAEVVPVSLRYIGAYPNAGLDLLELESAFQAGARVFVFSNPNNPTGVVFSKSEIDAVARLATRYGVFVIVDQLYSRMVYEGTSYSHLCAADVEPGTVITIMGPSKTESLSGYRLGVAFGSPKIITRMERLQAIVSLRAGGYSQSVLQTWFAEPAGWLAERIRLHQAIRDALYAQFTRVEGVRLRLPDAGSYLFPMLPKLSIPYSDFVRELRRALSIIVTPGTEFSPNAGNCIRLNFSQSHTRAVNAVVAIADRIERYRA